MQQGSNAQDKIPTTALVYGFAGLAPYIGAAGVITLQDPVFSAKAIAFIYGYSLVIMTFLGAIHWGRALAGDHPKALSWIRLGWSIIPAIIVPVVLYQPVKPAIPVLLACIFAYAFFVDIRAVRSGFFPPWYGRLRKYLTIGVLAVMFVVFLEVGQLLPTG